MVQGEMKMTKRAVGLYFLDAFPVGNHQSAFRVLEEQIDLSGQTQPTVEDASLGADGAEADVQEMIVDRASLLEFGAVRLLDLPPVDHHLAIIMQ